MHVGGRGRWFRRGRARPVAVLVVGGLVAAACGGGGGSGSGADEAEDAVEEGDAGGEEGATSTTDVLDNPRWANVISGPEATDEEPVQGGSIVVALDSEADTYLPSAYRCCRANFNVAYAIYDPLVARDQDGEIRPYLAESLEPNADFTEWALTLRPGVRFHDGLLLDAQVLKRIWDDHVAEGPITSASSQFVERLDVVDELTVNYVMTRPDPAFPDLLALPLGWPFSPDAADRLGDAYDEQPVGTGPFKFVSWQRDGDLVVERNDDYWQEGRPPLDKITFRPIPDETTRAASLASGDVDAVQSSQQLSAFAAEVADIDGVQVALGLGNTGGGVLFNTTAPPMDDLRVRQALAHAVDQQALIEVAAGEAAALVEARTQFYPEDSPFYSQTVADEWLGHDPERAKELYDAYVNDPERSDGKPRGEPISLTLNTLSIPSSTELGTAYEGFYEAVGFDVTVQPLDQGEALSARLERSYQAQIHRLADNRSPLAEFEFNFGDVPTNWTGFNDDAVADLIQRLRTAGDLDQQVALTEEFGLYLAEQVPWQWTGSDLPLVAAKDRVRGLRDWTFPDGTLGNGVLSGVAFWGQAWFDDDPAR